MQPRLTSTCGNVNPGTHEADNAGVVAGKIETFGNEKTGSQTIHIIVRPGRPIAFGKLENTLGTSGGEGAIRGLGS